jgi:cell division protein FtsW (lipid II flippase)
MMSDNRATIIGTMVLVAIVIFLMIFAPTLKLPDLIVIVFCVIPGLLFLLILKSRIVRYPGPKSEPNNERRRPMNC